ncbi:MAG: type IV secretion system protein [Spirochaetaceae bacterium]|jgi:type IV secretion system protein VirB5|nr:type IV secretion system protein [Spirochaetaceae bacterium]
MAAIHKSTTYKETPVQNPFTVGQDKAFGDILLFNQRELKWWRNVVAPGALLLWFICFCFFVYALKLQKTVPVLINVMPNGEASYLGEVKQGASMQVPESAILYQVRKFITELHSVSSDSHVLYNNIEECYAMVTSSYEPVMTRNLRANSPFALVGKVRRTVEIESALKVTGSSYQVDWIETSQESGGTKRTRKRAVITVKLLPVDETNIKKNPLGIYIDNCETTVL